VGGGAKPRVGVSKAAAARAMDWWKIAMVTVFE
jgi:hypothetical protein